MKLSQTAQAMHILNRAILIRARKFEAHSGILSIMMILNLYYIYMLTMKELTIVMVKKTFKVLIYLLFAWLRTLPVDCSLCRPDPNATVLLAPTKLGPDCVLANVLAKEELVPVGFSMRTVGGEEAAGILLLLSSICPLSEVSRFVVTVAEPSAMTVPETSEVVLTLIEALFDFVPSMKIWTDGSKFSWVAASVALAEPPARIVPEVRERALTL